MFVIFDPETGRVQHICRGPDVETYSKVLRDHGQHFLVVESDKMPGPSEVYVQKGVMLMRPVLPILVGKTIINADGEDVAVLAGFPKPSCMLKIDGEQTEITDGRVEIVASMPMVYQLSVEHFPYLPWQMEIVAT